MEKISKVTFEIKTSVVNPFLDLCAIKGRDPDRLLESLMRQWLRDEVEKMEKKRPSPTLARVVKFRPREG